ncbi:hypothetical protein FQA39_LY13051 [Lamprigera yunnana]|nr:hypothetical protein FQA39_LY13051 [Lamprigera yunnana]
MYLKLIQQIMKVPFILFVIGILILSVKTYEVKELQQFESRALARCNRTMLDYVINCIIDRMRMKLTNLQCTLTDADKNYIFQTITKELLNILGIVVKTCDVLKGLLDGVFTTVNAVLCLIGGILG